MTPLDPRAPLRNQRWVECESTGGSYELGDCVRVVDSYRPESGSTATPNGGRTVFKIATPEEDSEKNTVIVGHMDVTPTQDGYCTNDFPVFAKVAQGVEVGEEVGPVSGSTILQSGQTGYLVMGDVANGMARVRRLDGGTVGLIGVLLTTDRTRETDQVTGRLFGTAEGIVEDARGTYSVTEDQQVILKFYDSFYLGAVAGCRVLALDFGEEQDGTPILYVIDSLEPSTDIWFITLESRSGKGDQDVDVAILKNIGHTNGVYPPALWKGTGGTTGPGFATFTAIGGVWNLTSNNCGSGYSPPAIDGIPTTAATGTTVQAWCTPTGQQQADCKVRYRADTFPRMLEGAIGKATFDVDYENTTDNTTMRYYADVSDQMSPFFQVEHDKFCPLEQVSVSAFDPMMFFPFGQSPDNIASAQDYMGLSSDGGPGVIVWHELAEEFMMLQPWHTLTALVVEDEDDQSDCPQIVTRSFSMMPCGDAVPSTTLQYGDAITEIEFPFTFELGSGSDSAEICTNSSGEFNLNYKTQKSLLCGPKSAWKNASKVVLEPIAPAVDVADDEECIYGSYQCMLVPKLLGNEFDRNVVCTTDEQCSSGSDALAGDATVTVTASENLSAGDQVNVDPATGQVRVASNTDIDKMAHGYVAAAVTSGSDATVYISGGVNTAVSGLTPGETYYLGAAGGLVTSAGLPSASGSIIQKIGVALTANILITDIDEDPTVL